MRFMHADGVSDLESSNASAESPGRIQSVTASPADFAAARIDEQPCRSDARRAGQARHSE